jgi:cytochrome P450 family 6
MVDHEEKLGDTTDKKENDANSNVKWKHMKKSLTTKEILAQAILFLFAGSETSATTLSYAAMLLAKNPEIQNKLYNEINRVYQEHVRI